MGQSMAIQQVDPESSRDCRQMRFDGAPDAGQYQGEETLDVQPNGQEHYGNHRIQPIYARRYSEQVNLVDYQPVLHRGPYTGVLPEARMLK